MTPALLFVGTIIALTAIVAAIVRTDLATMWTLPGSGALVVEIAGIIFWFACYAASVATTDPANSVWLRDLASIGTLIAATSIAWFAARFTGRDALLSWGTAIGFVATNILLGGLIMTNYAHLYRTQGDVITQPTGPAYWSSMAWIVVVLAVASWQLTRHRRTVTTQQRRVADVLVFSIALVLLSSCARALGFTSWPVDATLFGKIVAIAGSVYALHRGLAPDIERIARAEFVRRMGDGVVVVDHDDTVVVLNDRAATLLGVDADASVGRPLLSLKGDDRAWRSCLARHLASTEVRDADGGRLHVRTERQSLRNRNGALLGTAVLIRDVTTMYLDPLTGVSNRRCFQDTAPDVVDAGIADGKRVCIVAMDLDNLKLVNDTHGHMFGDQAIMQAASAMRDALRVGDRLARLSGDEFVALLVGPGPDKAVEIMNRLRVRVEELRLGVTLTAGVAQVESGEDLLGALRRADEALYQAKRAGRNRVFVIENTPA